MQDLIKNIRQYVSLSQQELADKLGVTFATINRWENGKVIPTKLAQDALYQFCKDNHVPLYDLIMKRIQNEIDTIPTENDRILLFHGSKSGIHGPIAPISRNKCDFGSGFYMGTEPIQPLTLICDFEKSAFYVVSLSLKKLNLLEIEPNLDWAMTIAYNRGKMTSIENTALYEKYKNKFQNIDIVIGSIADDRMFYVLDNFFHGNITDLALINSLSYLQIGKQYVAITQKACDDIRIEKEISLSYLERKALQDISEENRMKGIKAANDICKNYRREGTFFDEILANAE